MEGEEQKDDTVPETKAFAITGFRTLRKPRRYRPSYHANIGLDPIYEDVKHFENDKLGTSSMFNPTRMGINDPNGTANFAFNRDYEEVNELESGVQGSGNKRSYSMYLARRHSPATEMLNDMMRDRIEARRKTEPTNQALQAEYWKGPDTTALYADANTLKRAKSSIYHKGNLYMNNTGSRISTRRKRWTKLEAEPPTDEHLCCPGERKMERRAFKILFVSILVFVCLVFGFMIYSWMIKSIDGDKVQRLQRQNRTMLQDAT